MSLSGPAGPINPEEAENFEDIEKQFAVKGARELNRSCSSHLLKYRTVVEHMSTYWAILEKLPGSKLRLTNYDDEIHEHFKKDFPDFNQKGLTLINPRKVF